MVYEIQQKDFTEELRSKIKNIELTLEKHIEKKILNENKTVFAKKNLEFDADFANEGDDPFMPGYTSSIATGITDNNKRLFSDRLLLLNKKISFPSYGII